MNTENFSETDSGRYYMPPNPPVVSLILLLTMMALGYFLFSGISIFLAFRLTDIQHMQDIVALLEGGSGNVNALKIIQAGTSIGLFILPAILLGVIERKRNVYLQHSIAVKPVLWLFVIGIMMFSAPIIEQSIKINEALRLPESLSGIENWMQAQEQKLKELTQVFLADTSYQGLVINLIVIAVIPAIGEEFLFRGCLQQIFVRWFTNPHVAIWVCAIIFSAIHMQFYGFLPRMLLGALFGYMFYWGKNIWLPVLGHFINNASATISAFYIQRQGKSIDEINFGDSIPFYVYIVSVAIFIMLMYQYWKTARTIKE